MELKRIGETMLWIGIGGFVISVYMDYDRAFIWLIAVWIGVIFKLASKW